MWGNKKLTSSLLFYNNLVYDSKVPNLTYLYFSVICYFDFEKKFSISNNASINFKHKKRIFTLHDNAILILVYICSIKIKNSPTNDLRHIGFAIVVFR